jgi:tetratricopeptide (TPR) repeat protein
MKISKPLAGILILLSLAVAGLYVYWRVESTHGNQNTPEASVSSSLAFQNEEEWTVGQIAQILADVGDFASKTKNGLNPVTHRILEEEKVARVYEIEHSKTKGKVSMADGVWNPTSYLDWGRAVLPKTDITTSLMSDWDIANQLLHPNTAIFMETNLRLSEFLSEHPGSGRGHLQAALLLGTIALNEHAGVFSDARPAINRMVAHMTAARICGVEEGDPTYRLAEAIRLTLCGLQSDALAELEHWKALPDASPILLDWSRVLWLRNTMDWRARKDEAKAGPQALRQEYFRAVIHTVDDTPAIDFIRSLDDEPGIGYWLIANEANLSVSAGHDFSKPMLTLMVGEVAASARAYGLEPAKENLNWMGEYLNTPAGLPVTSGKDNTLVWEVAGRNLMAARHQRQVMHGLLNMYSFLYDSWGVKDNASELEDFVLNKIPDLEYKPFLVRMMARSPVKREKANIACTRLIREKPQIVTPQLWMCLNRDEDDQILPLSYPDHHGWFSPEIPAGTAYQVGIRMYEIGVGDESDKVWLAELWKRAPYDYGLGKHICWLENGKTQTNMKPEILEKWMGLYQEYHIQAAMRRARAYQEQPEKYTESMKMVVALDASYYFTLGHWYLDRGNDSLAAESYLQGFDKSPDRVNMSNNVSWLIRYLHRMGDKTKALEVAKEAAEVYSYGGLEAYLWYAEIEAQWDEALATAKKLDARYNNNKPIEELGFLTRYHSQNKAQAEEWGYSRMINKLFPDGLKTAKLEDFISPPSTGVVIQGTNKQVKTLNMKIGDVIVSLDGYRTDNLNQYDAIRGFSKEETIKFIFWDGKSYRQTEGKLKGRRFGVDIQTYPTP